MGTTTLDLAALNPPMNTTLIDSPDKLPLLKDFFGRVNTFDFDVETDVQPVFTDRTIRTIQIGNRTEQYIIDLLPFAGSPEVLKSAQGNYRTDPTFAQVVDTIKDAVESTHHRKVGTNLEFDAVQLKWAFGLDLDGVWDCLLAEKVLHCGAVSFYEPNFWGLEDMVERYTGLKMSKELQKSFNLCEPLTEGQIAYAALDVRLPSAVRTGQMLALTKAKLMDTAELENAAMATFADMQAYGILLDKDAWTANIKAVEEQHRKNIEVLDSHFIPVVGDKTVPVGNSLDTLEMLWRNETDRSLRAERRKDFQEASRQVREHQKLAAECEGRALINYGSNKQLLEALRKMGFTPKQLPNTNDKTLSKQKKYPVIAAIQEYRDTGKKLTTYGTEFLIKYINPKTGRVHPSFQQIGAETGRTSCVKPNLQNIPKGSAYRSCFVARPGHVMVTTDMSGAELRIIADASGDPVWVDAFNNEWDVHSIVAEMMYGDEWRNAAFADCAYVAKKHKCKCPKHQELRDKVKAVNFGVAYGMEEAALAARLGITQLEARKLLADWRTAAKAVFKYLTDSGQKAKATLEARTAGGRRRIFRKPDYNECRVIAMEKFKQDGRNPLEVTSADVTRVYAAKFSNIEREGKNMPIQGGNADIAKAAMPLMRRELKIRFNAIIVNFVHDEFVVECPEQYGQEVMQFIGFCIREAGKRFLTKVTMEWEGSVDKKWKK